MSEQVLVSAYLLGAAVRHNGAAKTCADLTSSCSEEKKMKTIVLITLGFLSASAQTEQWEKTYSNEHATEYIDVHSIQREGSAARATFRRDYADPEMRKSFDENEKAFPLARSMSVILYECDGNEHTIEKVWDLSPDGKRQSPVKSYPKSRNNDTWDAAAKKAVCR